MATIELESTEVWSGEVDKSAAASQGVVNLDSANHSVVRIHLIGIQRELQSFKS